MTTPMHYAPISHWPVQTSPFGYAPNYGLHGFGRPELGAGYGQSPYAFNNSHSGIWNYAWQSPYASPMMPQHPAAFSYTAAL